MAWELSFMKWAAGWWFLPVLDQIVPWLTHLGSHFAVILFILVHWIISRKTQVLRSLVFLYAIQSAVLYGLKYLIQRPRPLNLLEAASRLPGGPGEILDPSFPSAHTVYAFMMATLLSQRFPRFRVAFYAVAGLIGWTRIYLNLHYPTDVLAGVLLGWGITKLLHHSLSHDFENFKD